MGPRLRRVGSPLLATAGRSALIAILAVVLAPTVGAQVVLPEADLDVPTVTVPDLTDAVSGATGSVSGATGSVSGATGSVSGATGSVSGATGSVSGATGSVSGATSDVTGATSGTTSSVTGATSDVTGATSSVTGGGSGGGSGASGGGDGTSSRTRDGSGTRTATRKDPELRASRTKFSNRRKSGEPYGTMLSFWLDRPGTVRLFIRREAPVCDPIGVMTRRADAGVNRVRFLGRWKGEPLPPGTYSITGVVVRGDRTRSIGTVRVVIVGRKQDTQDARMQRSRCGTPAAVKAKEAVAALVASGGGGSPRSSAVAEYRKSRATIDEGVAATTASSSSVSHEVLGPTPRDERSAGGGFVANPFGGAPAWLQALLLAALAIAIVLLAAAALPARRIHPTGAAVFVGDRRTQLALIGAAVLGTVAVSALLV